MKNNNYIFIVKELLKKSGYRNSYKRDCILDILLKSTLHLNAEEIKEQVYDNFKINISLVTVYNQLELLENFNIVKSFKLQMNRKKVYELNKKTNHNHLICIVCKKIIEIDTTMLDELVSKIANKKDFLVYECSLNLYGYCKECSNENKITSK